MVLQHIYGHNRNYTARLGLALCAFAVFFISPAFAQFEDLGEPFMPPALDRIDDLEDTGLEPDVPPPPGGRLGIAEQAQKELEEKARQDTFERSVEQLMPLRPEEIRELLRRFVINREAVEIPVDPYPEPQTRIVDISLDPSFQPPVIMTAPGHVTTVTILDSTGASWAIQDISWAGTFDISGADDGNLGPGQEGGHLFRITPLSAHGAGNMSIRLVGLTTPITFTLRTQNDVVDYRFDVRVPGFGPRARIPLIQSGDISAVAGNGFLTAVLDGTPPDGADSLRVSGVDGRTRAWGLGEQIFVRTPHTLLSPGWTDSVRSSDGTNVYSLERAPVLLMSENGQVVRAHISEYGDEDLP